MQHSHYYLSENDLFSSLSKRCTSSHGARHSIGSLLLPEPIRFKTPSHLLPARGLSVSGTPQPGASNLPPNAKRPWLRRQSAC